MNMRTRIDTGQIFEKINMILLNSTTPSKELNTLINQNYFNEQPFNMIIKLKQIEQSPIYHKEGNVFNHTMLVIDEAAKVKDKSKDSQIFMWAMLLHDLGKINTTKVKKGKITSYNHDKTGYRLSKEFLSYSNFSKTFIEKVSKLVRWHMQVFFIVKNLPFAEIKNMKNDVDIDEIALIFLCDKLGRKNSDKEKILNQIKIFKNKMRV